MMLVKQVEPKFPISCDLLHYHNITEIILKFYSYFDYTFPYFRQDPFSNHFCQIVLLYKQMTSHLWYEVTNKVPRYTQ